MATQYYVSTNGSDNWPGTNAQPFKTIAKGTKAVGAGDTLYIKNGTYVEVVNVRSSGTAAKPITIMAYPGHKPVVDGRAGVDGVNEGLPLGELKKINPNTGAGANFGGLFNVTGSHIIIDGFEIKRSMGRGMRIFSQIGANVEYVIVKNCNIHHSRQTNFLMSGPKTDSGEFTCSHVSVEDSQLSWSGNFFPERRGPNKETDWSACIVVQSAEYFTISRCEIYENWGEATIADANQGGSQNIIIEDCIYYDNFKGVYLHAVSNVVFQRNYLYRSTTDKTSRNPFGPNNGVKVAPAEHERFEQIGSRNIKILNNIIIDLLSAIGLVGTEIKEEITNVQIAYNTVINAEIGMSAKIFNKRNITYHNNLVVGRSGQILVDDAGDRTNNDWVFSNNLWSREPEALNGLNDVIGNPKLKNPNANPAAGQGNPLNYTIIAGSPAENAALLLDEPKDDFFQERRGGNPDIGSHELSPSTIKADFDANPLAGNAPLAVTFQDTSTSSESITSWLWDFGDGTISGQQHPTHVYQDGNYSVSLRVSGDAGADLVTKTSLIMAGVPPIDTPPRITDGLLALYRFDEGNGQILHDVSGEGTPLDLQIRDLAAISWNENGLAIVSPTMIASSGPAEKIIEGCQLTNEITVELWLEPANTTQAGPARIYSISQNVYSRDVTVGQGLWGSQPSDLFDIRLRTTERSANGMPSFSSSAGSLTSKKSHLIYTRNKSGTSRIFLNSKLVAETVVSGDFSTWNPRFPLLLANETTGDYPWLGQFFLLATYNRALSSSEVKQNFNAGTTSANNGSTGYSALLPSFKRFFIADTNGAANRSDTISVAAFGVQYPDQRCVTCMNDGDHELTIHENLEAALRSFNADNSAVTWVDL